MDMTRLKQFLACIMIGALPGLMAACASTPEHRSGGEYVSDTTLTARVKTALVQTEGLKGATDINVNTYRGEVQLAGYVDNADMIDRAVSTVRNVPGVRLVRNDLHVRPAQGATR